MQTMADIDQTSAENCIPDELDALLGQLSIEQIRFVIARQECSTDREAARAVGVAESTVYRWPETVKQAVRAMAKDGMVTAMHLRRRHLAKAMAVKVAGLDSKDERLRQGVATEIIEWELGRATQPTEIGGPNGGPIPIQLVEVVLPPEEA